MTESERPAGKPAPVDGDRPLGYDELVAAKPQLSAEQLAHSLRDGRAVVRANAALGLAAIGYTGDALVPFLRDADAQVAMAAAEALLRLGVAQRAHLVAIGAALDGARRAVVETIEKMFAELVGKADAELIAVLDTSHEAAPNAVVRAAGRLGVRGLQLLQTASRDDRARVRINAVRGIALLGDLDQATSMEALAAVERDDRVADVRAAARAAVGELAQRCKAIASARQRVAPPVALTVPELELRALAPAELAAAANVAPVGELLHALTNPRPHARINAIRVLALKRTAPGATATATANAVAARLRDDEHEVRIEAARALAQLGVGADERGAAAALVQALGDPDPDVIAAADAAVATLGASIAPVLAAGLEVANEPHGARIAAAIGRLADGPQRLRDALASTSVDVRVNAALGLAALGPARAGAAVPALAAIATGNNARLRAAIAKAIATLEPRPERARPRIAIDGFDSRELTDAELASGQPALAAAGVGGLVAHLHDAPPIVRTNAARALAALGTAAPDATAALGVALRDESPAVRLAAARAIGRLGDAAVVATAGDLIRALGDADSPLAGQLAGILRTCTATAIDTALVRGLETAGARHGERICEVICARPAAVEVLCDAFERPAAQAHAIRGLVMLGKDRIGRGRELLERARGDRELGVRARAAAALRELDGAPVAPVPPAAAGFETTLLAATAFAKLPLAADHLLGFLQDGRAVVRANAATALGTLGGGAAGLATSLGALLRDDDDRVRIAAAKAIDQLGDDAVVAAAPDLVGALGGSPQVVEVCRTALAARKTKVEAALIAGLETPDEAHGMRVAELICALPDARDLLFAAFDGEAQNVQINASLGIGLLGAKRAGAAGRRRLASRVPGPLTRRRAAAVKALAMLGPDPSR